MHPLTFTLLLLPTTTLASFNLLSLPETAGQLPDLPEGTTENPACIAAYNTTIDCEPSVVTNGFKDPNSPTSAELDKVCTPQCLTSLRRWIRGGEGCEGEDYLNYFGLKSDGFFDGNITTSTSDVQQYYITAAYHSKCMKDFSTNTYCLLSPTAQGFTQPALLNTSNPDSLCKDNSCGTQSAYLFAPIKTIYKYDPANVTENDSGEDSDLPMLSLEEACPGIDTSKYPLREEDVTAEMLKNGDDGNGSGNEGDKGGKEEGKPNGAVGGVRVGAGNVVVTVVVGILGFLAL